MGSKLRFNPPRPVEGHPVELVELNYARDSYIWLITVRFTEYDPPVESQLRYDVSKGITIDLPVMPPGARQALLDIRGEAPWDGNPLSKLIDASLPDL
ncbi:MAG: hypothetical protein QY323_00715 [Patescibacteria group bacterium]|nr:MAG: hypothetical protein QY323_00715 [Patescibacteria group bacterium]